MGKHRHSKDKMHLTYSEMREESHRPTTKIPFERLPFYCCSLSLSPFESPVCSPQGHVFDLVYVIPFIKKYHRCPVSGQSLQPSQLITMHWSRNEQNQYHDPISYKLFTDSTHIVCIRTSGHVYAYDTILELNKKPKFYRDLMTDIPFTLADIITLQDPIHSKLVADFDYQKNTIPFIPPEQMLPEIKENEAIDRVMEEVNLKRQAKEQLRQEESALKKKLKTDLQTRKDVEGFVKYCKENKLFRHERETEATASSSLTSTNFTPSLKTSNSYRELKQCQIREKIYEVVRKRKAKGSVLMATNLGTLSLLIHADLVPKTSQNFMELAESGYYNGLTFHRLVKDFCLQGGDPTGTGGGGQSIFGKPFQDQFHERLNHKKPGMLSMANSGPITNTSQFFITLAEAEGLDLKHSVFGQVIGSDGLKILYDINKNLTSKSNHPKREIKIEKMHVGDNPFRKVVEELRIELNRDKKQEAEISIQRAKERWIEESEKQIFKVPDRKEYFSKEMKKEDTIGSKLLKNYY